MALIASFLGMLVKYSEVYLGIKYRVKNNENGFDGGPMYYIRVAFKTRYCQYLFVFYYAYMGQKYHNF